MNDDIFEQYKDIFKALGYECTSEEEDSEDFNKEDFYNNIFCTDLQRGFQKMYPQLFVVIAEILGNIMARDLPINAQDALGNWLQLIGQIILTYNSQQQYFQGGPGRFFSIEYYNVSNPFCANSQGDESGENINKNTNKNTGNYSTNSSKDNREMKREIKNIKKSIEDLKREISKIKEC